MPIPQLPTEILEAILLQLPVLPDSKEGVRTVCRFGEANSRFLAISRSSRIWYNIYVIRWNRCHSEREEIRLEKNEGNWWNMCAARDQTDRRALDLLESIVTCCEQKDVAANEIASFGYDVWRALSFQANKVRQLSILHEHTTEQFDVPIEGLTLQYWAREVLGVISRIRAIDIWGQLTVNPTSTAFFEQGMAALSAFYGEDIDNISEELDRLAKECEEDLGIMALSNSARHEEEVLVAICDWMREMGFKKVDNNNFHLLQNHFLHFVLFGNPRTLPITLVYVFVCLARRFNINAYPVPFPHKVLAVILPPEDQHSEAIYVDVFESETCPILSYSEHLPTMLVIMGIEPATLPRYASPAPTAEMVLRAASNIMQSLSGVAEWHEDDHMAAHYAAYCAALLLTGEQRLVPMLFIQGVCGPLDRSVVLRGTLEKFLHGPTRRHLNEMLNKVKEETLDDPALRSNPRPNVRYFTGMVFRHKQYHYVGLIKGWDQRCQATDEWIHMMGVHTLARGAEQPFYQSLTPDGETRYVAEDNIERIRHPTPPEIHDLMEGNKDLGRWFDGFDINEGRFITSPEIRLQYPVDEAFATGNANEGPMMIL